ncbi:MAG TPA: hypothetical protein VLM76_05265 [Patescibacteria group bacterium]|nr:hypothetical protein [Patescibacteria group bacterium]
MVEELRIHRVEVSFVGTPPTRQVERASGVSDVAVAGSILCCLVYGSFQPFLEALRGHEVVSLTSIPTGPRTRPDRRDPRHHRGHPRARHEPR